MNSHRCYDISDKTWSVLEPHLPGRKGSWGGIGQDNRQFINAVFLEYEDRRVIKRSSSRL